MRLSPLAHRTVTRCLVCGFAEVRTDEVIDRGLILLSECPRCEHRTARSHAGPGNLAGMLRAAGTSEETLAVA